ncbi:MAG: hypothetical protein HY758_00905 [Nitrospirae bacterium]|nr:hypothetical protein [Nitrospirota bacterium]
MSHILIGGYNLIGIAHKSPEKARNDIIKALSEYSKLFLANKIKKIY